MRSELQAAGTARVLPRYGLFGVTMTAASYDTAVPVLMSAARARIPTRVSAIAVHGLMTGADDPAFARVLNRFDMLVPDGQPVRFALNALHGADLHDRVYGPELMLRLCRQAAAEGVGVYLYGSTSTTVEQLAANLVARFPELRLVGCEPSVFRPLTANEDAALVQRITDSGAGLVFLGLGCPLQERFADEHRDRIPAVQVCVGAAFDFHAGTQPMAPRWMQRYALEWLFRLSREPRRLWRRYTTTNTRFLAAFAAQWWSNQRGATS